MINVTKSSLPPLDEYIKYLEKIWDSNWLTNHGPIVQELEFKARRIFGCSLYNFCLKWHHCYANRFASARYSGDVITTPFSYVATTNSILREHCQPVFVDIDPNTFCIDPEKIEAAITENTQAILAVHVYGYPTDVEFENRVRFPNALSWLFDKIMMIDEIHIKLKISLPFGGSLLVVAQKPYGK